MHWHEAHKRAPSPRMYGACVAAAALIAWWVGM